MVKRIYAHLTIIKFFLAALCCTLFLVLANQKSYAQLCTGSLGDAVVDITFGAGTATHSGALATGTTSYTYSSANFPSDGSYTIENTTAGAGNVWWSTTDHTGDSGGYMMVVNASVAKTDYFYKSTVTGLCPGTTYEFAAWVVNLLRSSDISPPNITFTILTTGGTVLGTYNTGTIPLTPSGPVWKQYGLYFTTPTGVSDVVIQMTNNSNGGAPANDLALDDITFRPCGPTMISSFSSSSSITTQTSCESSSQGYTLTSSVSTGYTNPVYQWQVNNGSGWVDIAGATSTTYTATTSPATAGTYQYRLVSSEAANIGSTACQVASNILSLTVNTAPVAAFSLTGTSCLGDTTKFTDLSTSQGYVINTWAWDFGDGTTSSGQNPAHTYTQAGDYTIKLTVTNSNGCTAIATPQTIHIAAKPVAGFTMQSPACESPLTVTFTDHSTVTEGSITSWLWDFGDGTTSTTQSPVHTFASAQVYTVTLTVITDKNCNNVSTKSEKINFLPLVDFTLPDVCQKDFYAHFTSTATVADSTSDNLSYLWNFGDPAANVTYPNTATGKTAQHHYISVGTYNVTLTVTTANGCTRDTIKTLTVNGSNPHAAFTVSSNTCSNQTVIFTTNANVPGFNQGKVTSFVMDFGDGTAAQTYRIDSGTVFTHKYPILYTTNKTYTVKMTAYSGALCFDVASQTINILAVPKQTFAPPAKVCQNTGTLQLSNYVTELSGAPAGTSSFLIDGVASSDGTFNTATLATGLHTITSYYTATTTLCADTAIKTITLEPIATIDAGPTILILAGGKAKLKATSSGGNAVTYSWSPTTGLSDPTVLNPTASPAADTKYTLTATSTTDTLACPVSDTVTVKVLQAPVVPNTFTPNGDNVNDTWYIKYLDSYPDCTVEVFNRNGKRVFYSVGYGTPWDGRYNTVNLPVGVYYYVIDPKSGRSKIAGSVTILR